MTDHYLHETSRMWIYIEAHCQERTVPVQCMTLSVSIRLCVHENVPVRVCAFGS